MVQKINNTKKTKKAYGIKHERRKTGTRYGELGGNVPVIRI